MKTLKYFFAAIAATAILFGCKQTNPASQNSGSSTSDDGPATITEGTLKFNNQSEDTYVVNVESDNFSDQFEIAGNKNISKNYTISAVTGYYYLIKLKQKDGYVIYPTEHTFQIELTKNGKTICWDNSSYWFR